MSMTRELLRRNTDGHYSTVADYSVKGRCPGLLPENSSRAYERLQPDRGVAVAGAEGSGSNEPDTVRNRSSPSCVRPVRSWPARGVGPLPAWESRVLANFNGSGYADHLNLAKFLADYETGT